MTIFFIRHSESLKTAEDRHGGIGMPLTILGINNTKEIIKFLIEQEKIDYTKFDFFSSETVQVLQTAKIFENELGVKINIVSEIKNISIGVLDGLSKKEAKEQYPEIAENLEKWRKNEISINNFKIPDAENINEFYNRIYTFIENKVNKKKSLVIFGTRSVGVAIANIFSSFSRDLDVANYKRYLFDTSSVSKFQYDNTEVKILYLNKTDFIINKSEYNDK